MDDKLGAALEEQRRTREALEHLQRALRAPSGSENDSLLSYNPKVPIEAAVIALQVVPVLQTLGWQRIVRDVDGHFVELYPEYKSRVIQADLALLDRRGLPLVLVEIKRVGGAKDPAVHQLWGYAREAARMGAALRALVLTDGREWRVWPVRDAISADNVRHVSVDDSARWSEVAGVLGRDALYATIDQAELLASPRVRYPELPPQAPKYGDVENEALPRLGRAFDSTGRVMWVVARVWDDAAKRRFAKEHPGWTVSFECGLCRRGRRLGHDCAEGPLVR